MTMPSRGMAVPALPPPTMKEKVQVSTYVVLGEIERVDFLVAVREKPGARFKLVDYIPTFKERVADVLSIRVIENLKWPQAEDHQSRIRVIHFQGSTRKQFLERFSPGSRWILFLKPSGGHLKSDPPEFFGSMQVYRVSSGRGGESHPEPPDRLSEIKQALKESGTPN